MYFGDETSESEAFSILDGFVEAGGTLIDTADVYVGSLVEQIIAVGWQKSTAPDAGS
jgi:aryl-alcohol dehydrogenase (NADP+)